MKIQSSKSKKFNLPYKGKSSILSIGDNSSKKIDFSTLVKENYISNEIDIFNKELDKTIQELDAYAEKISNNPLNEELLKKYKYRLQRFLTKAAGMYQQIFETNTYRRNRFRKTKTETITVIQTIDTELEKLTMEILKREKSRINLLEKFHILKGLILDLKIGK